MKMSEEEKLFKAEVDDALTDVDYLLTLGANTRRRLRRKYKPGNRYREEQLHIAIDGISEVMGPIRSIIGTMQFRDNWTFRDEDEQRLRQASKALQAERHQLRMMTR